MLLVKNHLLRGQLQTRQFRNMFDFFPAQRHSADYITQPKTTSPTARMSDGVALVDGACGRITIRVCTSADTVGDALANRLPHGSRGTGTIRVGRLFR